jgi:carboxyl-terminal processing protease
VPSDAPADFGLFWEALGIVKDHYVDTSALGDENLTRGAIRGMVEALGDSGHTVYLTPDEVQAEVDALDGRVSGIGVSVDTRSGAPVIIAVFPGSPAAKAGLRPGDLIVSVDGKRADRAGLSDLLGRVRGAPGTSVTLGIEHPDGTREDVPMVREELSIPAASWSLVPGTTIADIQVTQFSNGAARETRRAVRQAIRAGATAIVLDLRGNPGGLVNEAIDVASMFLAPGDTVYQEQDRSGARQPVRTSGEPLAADLPMVVLVDAGSASSAEIVAAALHDNGRARVIGEPTFGTGTVLNLFPLSDGSAIRLGVIEWLTPVGASIFEGGIQPDQVVGLPSGALMLIPSELDSMDARGFRASDDAQLRRAARMLTADPDGTPRPAPPPTPVVTASPASAPTASAAPPTAPPSVPLEATGHAKEGPGA